MTSGAATAAGRKRATSGGSRVAGLAGPATAPNRGQGRTVRSPGPAPRAPRRVSGPARGAATTAPAPRITRPASPRRAPRVRIAPERPFYQRTLAAIAAVPDHRWLDRIVRGRAWIPVLGVLLIGVVAMQVEVLKLGASIGRSMNLATELQSRNQMLRTNVSQLGDVERIERFAVRHGMIMPGPTEVNFVPSSHRGAVHRAILAITAPDPATFTASLQADETAASGDATATANAAQAATAAANLTTVAPALSGTASSVSGVSSGSSTSGTAAPTDTGAASTTATTDPASTADAAGAASTATISSGGGTQAATGAAVAPATTQTAAPTDTAPTQSSDVTSGGVGMTPAG